MQTITMNERRLEHQDGTSLIEAMMAAALAILVLGSVLTLATQADAQRRTNVETSLAMAAAMNNLEQIRSADFATLLTLNGAGFDVPGVNGQPGGLTPVAGDPDGLPGEIRVIIDKQVVGATLYRVTSTVVWTGVSRVRTMSLDALIGDRK